MNKDKQYEVVIDHYDRSIKNLEKLLEHKKAERFCLLIEMDKTSDITKLKNVTEEKNIKRKWKKKTQ
tara:strand:- start:2594 stop:2794 length:201 start_codon:yes stop_codon:yes gene_type:complete